MPGIFGFYAFGEGRTNWNAVRFAYYGLNALQGRGQESVGLATLNADGQFSIISAKGFVDGISDKLEGQQKGHLGIGQVSPIEADPLVSVERPRRLVLAGDGMPFLGDSKAEAFQAFAQKLSQALDQMGDPLEAASMIVSKVGGGYSFIALTEKEEMICGRDRMGVKPLEVGSVGFDLGVVASETAALDVNGAGHSGSIKPGEVVVFDPMRITRRPLGGSGRCAYCSFEYVYLARPDSVVNGVAVQEVRERIGLSLAKKSEVSADAVVGVPETAVPFAMAYSNATGIPVKPGFVRTGRSVRSAIRPNQFERLMGVQLKLNPIASTVEGKSVVLIDDSVVRGNTLKNTVLTLKRRGAKQVHVRIGSPAIKSHCPFGVEIPPRDELIGRALSDKEISDIVGADTFAYLDVEDLVRAIGVEQEKLCLGCFTGEYPEDRS